MRKKVSLDQIKEVYVYAKKVYEGEITRMVGVEEGSRTSGMNSSSVSHFIYDFCKMMEGECYSRTINLESTNYLFEKIVDEFGLLALKNALIATDAHITYYNGLGYGKQQAKRRLVDEWCNKYNILF